MLEFVDKLRPKDRELLNGVLSDLVQDAAPVELDRAQRELALAKAHINRVNDERDFLNSQVSQTSQVIKTLERLEKTEKGTDAVVITALRDVLLARRYELRAKIYDLRPSESLYKKARLKQHIEILMARRDMARKIISVLRPSKEDNAKDALVGTLESGKSVSMTKGGF